MAKVVLTANLRKYYPESDFESQGTTLREVLELMEAVRPNFMSYLVDEQGHIRKHVNIFIDQNLVKDKTNLNIEVGKHSVIHLMQALSGG